MHPPSYEQHLQAVRERFALGQCYPMALALHEATGWKIGCLVATWKHTAQSENTIRSIAHAYAIAPDGTVLDALGPSTRSELIDRYFRSTHRHVCSAWEETFDDEMQYRDFLLREFVGGDPTPGNREEFDGMMLPLLENAREAVAELGLAPNPALTCG